MMPPAPQVLTTIADRLVELADASDDPVLGNELNRISALVRTVGEEYDRCVDSRLGEVEQLVRWLQGVQAVGLPEPERAEAERALRSDEPAEGRLRVSALDARLDALRRAAGRVQGVLETRDDPESRRLLAESWEFLGAALRDGATLERLW